jgi:hypothetical protein
MPIRVISHSIPEDNTNRIGLEGQRIDSDCIDLTPLEKRWEAQGKPKRQRAWLRYYYRNREEILASRKKEGIEYERTEIVSRGLIV